MAFFGEIFSKQQKEEKHVYAPEGSEAVKQSGATVQAGFPLAMAQAGQSQRVTSVKGKDETRRFLGSLGFAEGAEVTLISEMNGNVIVNVKGTRVAVSKSMAMRVYVA